MKVFQFKLTCWIALGFFLFLFLALVSFNIYAVHEIMHEAEERMEAVSRGILNELEARNSPPDGPIDAATIQGIDANMGFIARERRIGYAIVSQGYDLLYETPGFNLPLDRAFLSKPHERPFIVRVESEDHLDDALSEWHFLFRYEGDDFIIFTNDRGEYELVERLVEGLGIVLVLAIVLALPSGYFVSRKVLAPLDAIDAAVQKIRDGDLSARIPPIRSKDEVSRLVDTLNLTFEELQASFNRIQRFSADAAHELITPLTAVRGTMEVCLGRERNVEEYQEVLAESVERITSLSTLMKDLLLLAKPGTRAQKRHLAPVNFSSVAERAVEQAQAGGNAATIRVVCDIESDIVLPGSRSLLLRLCYNLVHNAIRFSRAGAVVTVVLRRKDDTGVLEVRDSGIGIRYEDREKIFEQFYQVEEGHSTGAGLGLSIVKWIVNLHDGKIDVESEPGRGALFRVALPLHAAASREQNRDG